MNIVPIILTGGFGKRLWPLSRQSYPKQFLPLANEQTMLQDTITRLDGIQSVNFIKPIIICNAEHRFLVADQLQQIQCEYQAIILEPVGRNTAPAIAAVSHYVEKTSDEKNILLILPADHKIMDLKKFDEAIDNAYESACNGNLITFGVKPNEAHTGYGYIKKGNQHSDYDLSVVEQFVEKPTLEKASEFIKKGSYVWNSGMFMFTTKTYLDAIYKFENEIFNKTKAAIEDSVEDLDFIRLAESEFSESPSNSIDYAVMEKAIDNGIEVHVATLEADWSDLGSWKSLWEKSSHDENKNVKKGDIITSDSEANFLYSDCGLLATVGIKDTVVVQTSDVVLVADKSKSEDVSKIVDKLLNDDREEAVFHRKVTRPWGTFDSIDETDTFKVKRLTVNPGAKLSLQMHYRREEFWVVVSGIAKVTRGENIVTLKRGETVHIPTEMTHSLENPYDELLVIIEVQIGDYFGEDDIVRFDDKYGRIES